MQISHFDVLKELGVAATSESEHRLQDGHPYFYLVLNCHGSPDILSMLFELAPDAEYRPLFLGVDSDDMLLLSPYIVQISNHTITFIHWLMEESHCFGFFYTAFEDIDFQLIHWQSLLIVEMKTSADSALFRFYDGEVFPYIVASLSLRDQQRFLEPCLHLYFQDKEAGWQLIQPSEHRALLAFYNLKNTSTQLSAPMAAEPIKTRTLAIKINQWLWKYSPHLMTRFFGPAIEKIILESIETASKHFGLNTERQIGLFVFFCFQFHPTFFKHPAVIEQFEQVALQQKDTASNQSQHHLDNFLIELHTLLRQLTFNTP